MAIKHGPFQKTFVKVFHTDIKDMESVVNDWLKANEGENELINIKLLNDGQSKALVMVLYKKRE